MKRKFLFLDASIPGNKKDAHVTNNVRVHAMREYRRRQRFEMVRKHQERLESATETSADVDVCTVTPIASLASTGLTADLVSHASLAMDLIDPFDSMSIRLPSHYQALLSHFLHDIGPLLLPGDPRCIETSWSAQWLQFAISRPTLLMATCCHAATHIDAISGRDRSVSTLQLQAMTTAALNRSLEGGPTDEVIGAVMMLGADAMIARNTTEFALHLDALDRMTAMRGGIHQLGGGNVVQMSVGWHVLPKSVLSAAHRGNPLFQTALVNRVDDVPSVRSLINKCTELTRLLQTIESTPRPAMLLLRRFSDERSSLDHALGCKWYELQHGDPDGYPHRQLDHLLCLAALAYTFCHLRKFVQGPWIQDVIDELIARMPTTVLIGAEIERVHLAAILWVAMVAVKFCHEPRTLARALEFLRGILLRTGTTTVERVDDCLVGLPWNPTLWDTRLRKVVEEVASSSAEVVSTVLSVPSASPNACHEALAIRENSANQGRNSDARGMPVGARSSRGERERNFGREIA